MIEMSTGQVKRTIRCLEMDKTVSFHVRTSEWKTYLVMALRKRGWEFNAGKAAVEDDWKALYDARLADGALGGKSQQLHLVDLERAVRLEREESPHIVGCVVGEHGPPPERHVVTVFQRVAIRDPKRSRTLRDLHGKQAANTGNPHQSGLRQQGIGCGEASDKTFTMQAPKSTARWHKRTTIVDIQGGRESNGIFTE